MFTVCSLVRKQAADRWIGRSALAPGVPSVEALVVFAGQVHRACTGMPLYEALINRFVFPKRALPKVRSGPVWPRSGRRGRLPGGGESRLCLLIVLTARDPQTAAQAGFLQEGDIFPSMRKAPPACRAPGEARVQT